MQPWIGEEEAAAAAAAVSSGWVAQGPRVAEFEHAFAEALGVPTLLPCPPVPRHCISLSW